MEKEKAQSFSIKKRMRSFVYAFNGLKILFREEHNARIHLAITIAVIAGGIFFRFSTLEWIIVCLLIGFVFAMELLNSALENLCDYVNPEYSEIVKKIKDLSAAAVLIAAITSAIAGSFLFIAKFIQMLE